VSNFSQVSSEFGRRLTEALAKYHMVGIPSLHRDPEAASQDALFSGAQKYL